MNPWLSADNATADWRAAKLEWIVKDAEAKIAAEKLRIAAAKMQFRGTSVRSSQSCKVATFKNQTSFSTRFVKFAKPKSLLTRQKRSSAYERRLKRRQKEREETEEVKEKIVAEEKDRQAVIRFAARWCSEHNVMKKREENKEKLRLQAVQCLRKNAGRQAAAKIVAELELEVLADLQSEVVRELQAENVEAEEKADTIMQKYKEVQIRYKEQRLERERQELLKKGSDELLKKGSDVQQLRQQSQKAKTTYYRSQWTVKL
jgi:hypothetical protein